jgi:hypothetical protein
MACGGPSEMRVRTAGIVALILVGCGSARADDVMFRKDSIFVFGGVYSSGNMGQSLNPFYHHERAYIAGTAYRRDLADLGPLFVLGAEAGIGGRFGGASSAEFWAGPSLRLRGIPLGSEVKLAPGIVAGLSAVTKPTDIEHQREIEHNGNASLLFYLAPELALQFTKCPTVELVYRLHHRSGLYNALGKMQEGSNAHVLGLRWHL